MALLEHMRVLLSLNILSIHVNCHSLLLKNQASPLHLSTLKDYTVLRLLEDIMLSLKPYTFKSHTLKNRLVLPPMCMYQAVNGQVQAFHVVHYATRAVGGVGMIIVEATAVSPEGRITDQDLGLWDDHFIQGHQMLTDEIHRYGAKAVIQLQHAGRKSGSCASPHMAPSALAYSDDYALPVALSEDEIFTLKRNFIEAALRAEKAGYDGIELHAAHGYLLHEFLSPLSNHREDNYGGSLDKRARLIRELITEIRQALNPHTWLQIRISASDYDPKGLNPQDLIKILMPVKQDLEFVHVSSGGNVSRPIELKTGYQVEFSLSLKKGLNIPTIAVGLITQAEDIEAILMEEKADLVAMGRELLRNPYYVNDLYASLGQIDDLPISYHRAYK